MEQDRLREEAGVRTPSSETDRAEMPGSRLAPRHLPTLPTKVAAVERLLLARPATEGSDGQRRSPPYDAGF